jgi:hypothetical protein
LLASGPKPGASTNFAILAQSAFGLNKQRAPDNETGRPALRLFMGYNFNPLFYWIF